MPNNTHILEDLRNLTQRLLCFMAICWKWMAVWIHFWRETITVCPETCYHPY